MTTWVKISLQFKHIQTIQEIGTFKEGITRIWTLDVAIVYINI